MKRFLLCVCSCFLLSYAEAIDIVTDICDASGWLTPEYCEMCRLAQDAPAYYCDCHAATPFYYGLDTVISDTAWFSIPVQNIRQQGLTAFWFSPSSVTLEVYLQCVQTAPFESVTIRSNRSYMMDPKVFDKMLTESGVASFVDNRRVYFRVYPNQGQSGRVLGLPYDEGFHSTCDNIFPAHMRMTYPFTYTDNVYELSYEEMRSPFFVQWKQQKRNKLNVALTLGSCTGDTIFSTVLTDSTHVYFPSPSLLQQARDSKQSLFFHCQSTGEGRLMFVDKPYWLRDTLSYAFCEGKTVVLPDTVLWHTATYTDTTWVVADTCMLKTYDVTVFPAIPQDTTLYLASSQFPYRFDGWYPIRSYGSLVIRQENEGQCTRVWNVSVEPAVPSAVLLPMGVGAESSASVFVLQLGQSLPLQVSSATSVSVYTLTGKLLQQSRVDALTEHSLSFSEAGQYLLQMQTAMGVQTARVLVVP